MDTLTQITLGAACGEAVLGRKLGNRAMAWGAFGGLLPDLDVAANLFTNEIYALEFHRGFMHSLFFAVVAAIGLSWLVDWLYQNGHYKKTWFKRTVFSFLIFLFVLVAGAANYVTYSAAGGMNLTVFVISILLLGVAVFYSRKNFYLTEWQPADASRKEWFKLFFWSISTHILLDLFTSYGTQIFQPFSNYAVAFSSISVIDPLYTVPFLGLVIYAFSLPRNSKKRYYANWLGIGISSAYLLFTVSHKWQVDQIFSQALAQHNIPTKQFTTSPTMFNNYLWQGIAETEDGYHHVSFSLLDQPLEISNFNILSKNHELLSPLETDDKIQIIKWFTKGYYNVIKIGDEKIQLNDLRYGSAGAHFDRPEDFAFHFIIEDKDGKLSAHQKRAYHSLSWKDLENLYLRIIGKK